MKDSMPEWLEHGVLVYGPRKGGTTLFQNLLDGTPEMLVYPAELKLKFFARDASKMDDIATYYEKSRIASVKSSNFDSDAYEARWAQALHEGELSSFDQFIRFDALAVQQSITGGASSQPVLWAAKEVGGPTDAILANWKRMFPKGKALFIVRDPLMVTRAVLNDRKRKGVRLSIREIVHQALDPLAVVTAQARYLGDPYLHVLAYEDLVADTAGEMKKIAAFLGIPYSPVLTTPTIFGEPQVVRTSSRKTTEVFAPVETWTEGLTSRERIAVKLATRFAKGKPRYNVDYQALRSRIRGSGGSA
jgi:hypothetical protein